MKAFLAVVTLLSLAICTPVVAQTAQCAGLAEALTGLSAGYGESIVWEGAAAPEGRLVVTARPDGTTWTALMVLGDLACLVASGNGWSGVARPAGEDI